MGGRHDSPMRQLRLVEEVKPRLGAPANPPLDPSGGPLTSKDADPSLAAYVLGLGAGSACFCCGTPLSVVEAPSPSGGGGDENRSRLECRSCGASVEGTRGSS